MTWHPFPLSERPLSPQSPPMPLTGPWLQEDASCVDPKNLVGDEDAPSLAQVVANSLSHDELFCLWLYEQKSATELHSAAVSQLPQARTEQG